MRSAVIGAGHDEVKTLTASDTPKSFRALQREMALASTPRCFLGVARVSCESRNAFSLRIETLDLIELDGNTGSHSTGRPRAAQALRSPELERGCDRCHGVILAA
jgi:hypothetical protein